MVFVLMFLFLLCDILVDMKKTDRLAEWTLLRQIFVNLSGGVGEHRGELSAEFKSWQRVVATGL